MNLSKTIYRSLLILSVVAATSVLLFGQADQSQRFEASYNVSLQLVIGSSDAGGRGELPADLAAISRQIKGNFPFTNYRLASTLLGRISNTGNYEYKSAANIFGAESSSTPQTFIEWYVGNFKAMPNAKGQNGFQLQSLRFGARVPVMTSMPKDESGHVTPVINYEQIGLSLNKVGLLENQPTLIGTLNLPGANGTIFLIMTVKSAD